MKRLFKKFVTLALAAATLSSTAVFAQNEMTNMVFAGYDTSAMLEPNYIYNEVVDGKYTDKQILVRVDDKDIQWRTDDNCVEAVYPYAGYSVMYIKNPVTGAFDNTYVTAYNNTNPQWQTRRADWVFELVYPYTIWERQQTNTAFAGWQWDRIGADLNNTKWGISDSALVRKTTRNAEDPVVEWIDYGFARYDNDGVILDAYKTIGDVHCDDCSVFTYNCAKCASLLPVAKYPVDIAGQKALWSKEDTDMYATQLFFGVLEEAVTGDGLVKAAFDPAAFLADVQEVRACNKHVAKCILKTSECPSKDHKHLTLAGVLANKYGIQGWDELVKYVLTPANLTARGTVIQDEKYDRKVYGNLLAAEGTNRYFLTDDVIAELIPTIKAKKVTASFTNNPERITKIAVEEYIKSETAGIDFAKKPVTYYTALTDNKTTWDWSNVDALDVKYGAKIDWTTPNFEAAVPHKYYQYMIVDGIVLNGADKKPLVWRYTGSNANPVVEWKLEPMSNWIVVEEGNEAANTLGLYATVERMYVNGAKTIYTRVPAVEFNANTVANWHIGNPAKEYAYSYFKSVEDGKYTDYYITDNNGVNILVYRQVNYGTLTGASTDPNLENPTQDQLLNKDSTFTTPVITVASR